MARANSFSSLLEASGHLALKIGSNFASAFIDLFAPPSERFTKDSVGTWEVHFERQLSSEEQEQTTLQIEVEELSPLEGRLVGHGWGNTQTGKPKLYALRLWEEVPGCACRAGSITPMLIASKRHRWRA